MTSVTIPNGVISIGSQAFSGCTNLANVTIPQSVSEILDNAFASCTSLTSLTIPTSVINIGVQAFNGCTSLTSITMSAPNAAFSSVDGVLFDQNQATLIQYPAGKAGNYTIPNSVTAIGDFAFVCAASLTSVTIPNSVTSIGNYAFWGCTDLTNVTIPNSVGIIGHFAFLQCSSLTSVTIPESVTSIESSAFFDCSSMTSVTIPASVTSIGNAAFVNCSSLASAVFLGNAPAMGLSVFQNAASGFSVEYYNSAMGFTSPTWTDSSGAQWPAINLGPFSGTPVGSGWAYSSWFGTYYSTNYPWIYQTDLGFIYVSTSNNTDLYLYVVNGNSGSMGWLYTTPSLFPNVYDFSEGAWLWFGGGTSFYNYTTQAWETY